jgi:DUF1009 family protein
VARAVAGFDIGQTVVVAAQACVAVEAMEGTDAAIERAGQLMRSLGGDASTLERRLTVVKVAKPESGHAFRRPVIGIADHVETMIRPEPVASPSTPGARSSSNATALLSRAGRKALPLWPLRGQ